MIVVTVMAMNIRVLWMGAFDCQRVLPGSEINVKFFGIAVLDGFAWQDSESR